MTHLSDEIELYALGMLEPAERAQVDRHVANCVACSARLADAESTVALMLDATVAPEAAPSLPRSAPAVPAASRQVAWISAAAAAFAMATGALGLETLHLRSAVQADDAQFERMVHSHFNHAQFASAAGTPVAAKVIYERAGAWYDIVATDPRAGWRVSVRFADGRPPLTAVPLVERGGVATLALGAGAIREIDLQDAAGRAIGSVKPFIGGEERGTR